MAQYAANEIENMPDSPVAREDLGAGGIPPGCRRTLAVVLESSTAFGGDYLGLLLYHYEGRARHHSGV